MTRTNGTLINAKLKFYFILSNKKFIIKCHDSNSIDFNSLFFFLFFRRKTNLNQLMKWINWSDCGCVVIVSNKNVGFSCGK